MARSALTPPTPPNLDATSRAMFRAIVAELRASSSWRNTDAPAVERLVRAIETGRHARARIAARARADAARARRRRKAGELPAETETAWTARGSTGQAVAHPDVGIAERADRDASSFAEALLLTPKARAQHPSAGAGGSELDRELARLLDGVGS